MLIINSKLAVNKLKKETWTYNSKQLNYLLHILCMIICAYFMHDLYAMNNNDKSLK